jgi:hypothetical protein
MLTGAEASIFPILLEEVLLTITVEREFAVRVLMLQFLIVSGLPLTFIVQAGWLRQAMAEFEPPRLKDVVPELVKVAPGKINLPAIGSIVLTVITGDPLVIKFPPLFMLIVFTVNDLFTVKVAAPLMFNEPK